MQLPLHVSIVSHLWLSVQSYPQGSEQVSRLISINRIFALSVRYRSNIVSYYLSAIVVLVAYEHTSSAGYEIFSWSAITTNRAPTFRQLQISRSLISVVARALFTASSSVHSPGRTWGVILLMSSGGYVEQEILISVNYYWSIKISCKWSCGWIWVKVTKEDTELIGYNVSRALHVHFQWINEQCNQFSLWCNWDTHKVVLKVV